MTTLRCLASACVGYLFGAIVSTLESLKLPTFAGIGYHVLMVLAVLAIARKQEASNAR